MSPASNDRLRVLVDRLIYTERGQIICSVLFGFALALLFRTACDGGQCKVILAPPLEHIHKTVFELEGDCYRYKPVPIKCPSSTATKIVPSDTTDTGLTDTEKTIASAVTSTLVSAVASV